MHGQRKCAGRALSRRRAQVNDPGLLSFGQVRFSIANGYSTPVYHTKPAGPALLRAVRRQPVHALGGPDFHECARSPEKDWVFPFKLSRIGAENSERIVKLG